MKKNIITFLSFLFLAVMFFFTGEYAEAAVSGDFEYEVLADDTARITNYIGTVYIVSIPEDLEGHSVTQIASNSFSNRNLYHLTIPATVTLIESGAFTDNEMETVTIRSKNCVIPDEKGTFGELPRDTLLIRGYEGSTAEQYAQKYGCDFRTLHDLDASTINRRIPQSFKIIDPPTTILTFDHVGKIINGNGWQDLKVQFELYDSVTGTTTQEEIRGPYRYFWRNYSDYPEWLTDNFSLEISCDDLHYGKNTATVKLCTVLEDHHADTTYSDTIKYYDVGSFEFDYYSTSDYALKYDYKLNIGNNILGTVSSLRKDYVGRLTTYFIAPEDGNYRIQFSGSKVSEFVVYNCTEEHWIKGWDADDFRNYEYTVEGKKGKMYRITFSNFESLDAVFNINITKTDEPKAEEGTPNKDTSDKNITNSNTASENKDSVSENPPKFVKDSSQKAEYVITSSSTVSFYKVLSTKVKSASVPASVKLNGVTYKVTAISDGAFKDCKKLTKVTIGGNIKTIGKKAFYNCKNLKTITIKSKSLKKVGSKAFKGINRKAKIKVPKKQLSSYKKLLKGRGQTKTVKVIKK